MKGKYIKQAKEDVSRIPKKMSDVISTQQNRGTTNIERSQFINLGYFKCNSFIVDEKEAFQRKLAEMPPLIYSFKFLNRICNFCNLLGIGLILTLLST